MNSKLNTIILTALMIFAVTTGAAAQDSWYAQSSGTVDQLMDVHFADADNGWAEGDNVFTFSVRDVTPAPFNQPPYPASDDTDFDSCTVIGLVP